MSDHIPIEMQEEIIRWLPVKPLIQFRSVSKTWRCLIDSHRFIAAQSVLRPRSHRLLVRYTKPDHIDEVYLSIVDDGTFPQNKFALTVPSSVELLHDLTIFGNCHGLFCMYGVYEEGDEPDDPFQRMAVLWNPSIRKTVAISLPNEPISHGLVFGFGVCPVTSDIKILMNGYEIVDKVTVFMFSSGIWRSSTINLPGKLPNFEGPKQVVVEHDASVNALLGFRRSGEHLLEVQDDEDKALDLVALADSKDYSEHYYYYDDIYGAESSFCVYSYKETLLLHNQPDFISCLALDEDEHVATSNEEMTFGIKS